MPKFFQKSSFLLISLLVLFTVKGLLFTTAMPFFQNPDEQVHYATIQHQAEPQDTTWPIKNIRISQDPRNIKTYNFSDELTKAAIALKFDEIHFEKGNIQQFSTGSDIGPEENSLLSRTLPRVIDTLPAAVSGTISWYYLIGSYIERALGETDIFTRIFAIRILSVMLGLLVIFLGFRIAHIVGFSRFESICITTLLVFQPMFATSAAQVNIDIALIFSFSLFVYAGVSLLTISKLWIPGQARDDKQWIKMTGYSILAVLAAIFGFYAKGPGIVLVAMLFPLFAYVIWKYFSFDTKKYLLSLAVIGIISIRCIFVFFPQYLANITASGNVSKFSSPVVSLSKYTEKTFDIGEFRETALSYWGNFGWLDTRIREVVFEIIWIVEIVGLIGFVCFFVPWQRFLGFARLWRSSTRNDKLRKIIEYFAQNRDFLPKKRYFILFLAMAIALQLAIRFYDWRIFDTTGKILIGTPGRYFLPNVIGHIILLITGLGFFLRSRAQFHVLLKSLVIIFILLNIYIFLDVIIPRYYL